MTDADEIPIDVSPVERGVPASVRHRNRVRTAFEVVLLMVSIAALVVAGVVLHALGQVQHAQTESQRVQQQTLCIARLQGDFESAVGEALNAPPAPNPRRDQAVTDIASSADRLKRSAKLCP